MSFMKNIFGKGKKKDEKEEEKHHVRFRSKDSVHEVSREGRPSIGFSDRTFGEESLSGYARSYGKKRERGPQSLPGRPADDTRSVGSRRGNRSVIASNHEKHYIDYIPEQQSFHFNRSQRSHRRRDRSRSEFDLSLSDQENEAYREAQMKVKKYKDQNRTLKDENNDLRMENTRLWEEKERMREENERLKKERTIMDGQLLRRNAEVDKYRLMMNQWGQSSYASTLPPPGVFPSHLFSSSHQSGSESLSSRADTLSILSPSSQESQGASLTTPHFNAYHHQPQEHPFYPQQ